MQKIKRKTLLYRSGVEYADYALNHAEGCSHGCLFPCYAMMLKKRTGKVKTYQDWREPKIVENALELLDQEIPKLKNKISRVFMCFATDPFMYKQKEIIDLSLKIIEKLNELGLNMSLPAIKRLYKEIAEYMKDGNSRKINIPFPEVKRRIKGFLSGDTRKETWVKLESDD